MTSSPCSLLLASFHQYLPSSPGQLLWQHWKHTRVISYNHIAGAGLLPVGLYSKELLKSVFETGHRCSAREINKQSQATAGRVLDKGTKLQHGSTHITVTRRYAENFLRMKDREKNEAWVYQKNDWKGVTVSYRKIQWHLQSYFGFVLSIS